MLYTVHIDTDHALTPVSTMIRNLKQNIGRTGNSLLVPDDLTGSHLGVMGMVNTLVLTGISPLI